MNLDTLNIGHILVVFARLLEMFSFGVVLAFVFKGVALRFVFLTAGITVGAILVSIFGYLGGFLSSITSFFVDIFAFSVVLFIAFYAFMDKREKRIMPPPPPQKGTRCPVCGGFVKPEDNYAVAREDKDLLYFDSLEHLQNFLENFQDYKRLRRLNFKRIEEVYLKGETGWKRVEESGKGVYNAVDSS